jgi:hypothetical protein
MVRRVSHRNSMSKRRSLRKRVRSKSLRKRVRSKSVRKLRSSRLMRGGANATATAKPFTSAINCGTFELTCKKNKARIQSLETSLNNKKIQFNIPDSPKTDINYQIPLLWVNTGMRENLMGKYNIQNTFESLYNNNIMGKAWKAEEGAESGPTQSRRIEISRLIAPLINKDIWIKTEFELWNYWEWNADWKKRQLPGNEAYRKERWRVDVRERWMGIGTFNGWKPLNLIAQSLPHITPEFIRTKNDDANFSEFIIENEIPTELIMNHNKAHYITYLEYLDKFKNEAVANQHIDLLKKKKQLISDLETKHGEKLVNLNNETTKIDIQTIKRERIPLIWLNRLNRLNVIPELLTPDTKPNIINRLNQCLEYIKTNARFTAGQPPWEDNDDTKLIIRLLRGLDDGGEMVLGNMINETDNVRRGDYTYFIKCMNHFKPINPDFFKKNNSKSNEIIFKLKINPNLIKTASLSHYLEYLKYLDTIESESTPNIENEKVGSVVKGLVAEGGVGIQQEPDIVTETAGPILPTATLGDKTVEQWLEDSEGEGEQATKATEAINILKTKTKIDMDDPIHIYQVIMVLKVNQLCPQPDGRLPLVEADKDDTEILDNKYSHDDITGDNRLFLWLLPTDMGGDIYRAKSNYIYILLRLNTLLQYSPGFRDYVEDEIKHVNENPRQAYTSDEFITMISHDEDSHDLCDNGDD